MQIVAVDLLHREIFVILFHPNDCQADILVRSSSSLQLYVFALAFLTV